MAGGKSSRLEGLQLKAQGRTEQKAHQWAKAPWGRGRGLGQGSGKHLGGHWNSPQLGFLEARGVPVPLGVGLPTGLALGLHVGPSAAPHLTLGELLAIENAPRPFRPIFASDSTLTLLLVAAFYPAQFKTHSLQRDSQQLTCQTQPWKPEGSETIDPSRMTSSAKLLQRAGKRIFTGEDRECYH